VGSGYTGERRARLETLAELLPEHGLVGRLVGGDDPVLWVWHPHSGRQTIIFATPSSRGWQFLWSPDGQDTADDPQRTAATLRQVLDPALPE
jgi:hypothetical protein